MCGIAVVDQVFVEVNALARVVSRWAGKTCRHTPATHLQHDLLVGDEYRYRGRNYFFIHADKYTVYLSSIKVHEWSKFMVQARLVAQACATSF